MWFGAVVRVALAYLALLIPNAGANKAELMCVCR